MNADVLGYCSQAEFPSDRLKLTGPLIYRVRHSCILFFFFPFFQNFYQVISKVILVLGSPGDGVVSNGPLTIRCSEFHYKKVSAHLFACL